MKRIKQILLTYWPLVLMIMASSLLFLTRLNKDLLMDWDECLYGQYAKEMSRSGNFLSNSWNGNIDLQKPPLYTWFLQIPRLFSTNEFALRSLSVAASLGLLVAVYVFSKKYFSSRVAILADLFLLSSELVVIYSTKLNTDIFFTLFIFLGFWSWIISFKKFKYSFLAGLFLGLAVMVKGLGSLQFLLAMFVSVFIEYKKEYLYNFFRATSVFLVVIIPWHLAAYIKYGYEFFRVYFLENIIKRSSHPIEFHRERWYFYPLLIFRELFPWIIFSVTFPILYLFKIKTLFSAKALRKELKDNKLIFIIILFIIIPLISITRVKTKIAWYAMPLYPFICLYLAYSIDILTKKIKLPKIIFVVMFLVALDAGQLMIHENRFLEPPEKISVRNEVAIKASKLPAKELDYLVPFGERQAKKVLPPEEQIPQTWIFGGNPCSVYYSQKKVRYYYQTSDFEKKLQSKKGLYLIENGDTHFIEQLPTKTLFKSSDYTLFTF